MNILFKRRKKKEQLEKDSQLFKKADLPELIERLKTWQRTLNWIGSAKGKEAITNHDLKILKDYQEQVINLLPDEFQKGVFRILTKYEFNLLEVLDHDWKETLRKAYKDIAFYLSPDHPLNYVGDKLPVQGKDLLFWMLKKTKEGDAEDRFLNIAKSIKEGDVCGQKISEEKLKQDIVSIIMVVLFGKEYGFQARVFIDIICELEEGERFIKEEILAKV